MLCGEEIDFWMGIHNNRSGAYYWMEDGSPKGMISVTNIIHINSVTVCMG